MQTLKRITLVTALLSAISISGYSQIYIRMRPERPKYVRVAAPTTRHVWIEDDWEPRGGQYVFVGGRWAEPPRPKAVWAAGHWAKRPRGWVWIPGHWR